ncbi:UBP-type zinc finger domain-containing protein [Microbacterium sp. P04]|uniref:UBP-type zinc finger domain-containing protein n=1 Tax=Microbacterium sp. P04 TaxID=3366947 RepID=UPI0037468655
MSTDQIDTTAAPSGTSCPECDELDGWWVHLRRCAACGHIGCCDDSLGQHATAHWQGSGHRFIQSFEPGEDWWWDYEAQTSVEGPALAEPTSRPEDQPSPGPLGRVPGDWRRQLLARARARADDEAGKR